MALPQDVCPGTLSLSLQILVNASMTIRKCVLRCGLPPALTAPKVPPDHEGARTSHRTRGPGLPTPSQPLVPEAAGTLLTATQWATGPGRPRTRGTRNVPQGPGRRRERPWLPGDLGLVEKERLLRSSRDRGHGLACPAGVRPQRGRQLLGK